MEPDEDRWENEGGSTLSNLTLAIALAAFERMTGETFAHFRSRTPWDAPRWAR